MYTLRKDRIHKHQWALGGRKRQLLFVKRVTLVSLSGLLALTSAMVMYGSVLAAANITGVVYNDFNGNGVRDNVSGTTPNLAVDSGVANVTVKAFDENEANCATTTTAADGTYTLPMGPCSGTGFRVEFSDFPAGTEPSAVGGQNATTTQFVAEGGTADLGIAPLGSFCQNNPTAVTTCYAFGERPLGLSPDAAGIKGSTYTATDMSASTLNLGSFSDVGTIYGMTYRKADRTVYASAMARRHSDFGPNGIGAIYQSGPIPANSSGSVTPSHLVSIPNAGVDRHPVSSTNCDGRDGTPGGVPPGGDDCWSWDQFMFDAAGKSGLGDMDIYEDPANPANDALFVVNLNDRNLYKVTDLDGTPSVGAPIAMPLALPGAAQGCALADVRPFGLGFADGVGYAGLTCSAESTSNQNDLRAYVYTFDPVSGAFDASPALEVPLDYQRGCTDGCSPLIDDWNPWINTFAIPPILEVASSNPTEILYPSPMLSDIVVGANGSMTLGFRDRFGDQVSTGGGRNTTLGDTQDYTGINAGDILRACLVGGTWTLESNGLCDGLGPGPAGKISADPTRGQGPGGNEFYNHEFYDDGTGQSTILDETAIGSVANVPGFTEVMATVIDPLTTSSYKGGTHIYNTNTALKTGSHEIQFDNDFDFIKTNGLGDLEVLCDMAPIEIGNRIWRDTNKNGVQDPEEPPIAGVTVNLYDTSNTLIGTTTTDAEGDFIFSNRITDPDGNPLTDSTGKDYDVTGLMPNTSGFQLRLDNPDDYTDPNKLQGLFLTIPDSTQDNGNGQNDSEATTPATGDPSAANAPFITFATGPSGANNHTYDFGFVLEAVAPPPNPDGGSSSGSGSLANTGSNMFWLIAASAVLIGGGGGAYFYLRRQPYAQSR